MVEEKSSEGLDPRMPCPRNGRAMVMGHGRAMVMGHEGRNSDGG